eukprot:8741050-Alexandrium_andersonii.AAC.1
MLLRSLSGPDNARAGTSANTRSNASPHNLGSPPSPRRTMRGYRHSPPGRARGDRKSETRESWRGSGSRRAAAEALDSCREPLTAPEAAIAR